MSTSKTQLSRDPAFERFLGAAVGEDKSGANVSVLSMLARLDVDPWEEASDLARMQEAPARHRLEALLARFKDVPTLVSDRGRIALRLLAFLPGYTKSAEPATNGAPAQSAKLPIGAPVYWIIATILFLGWIAKLAQGN